MDEMFWDEIDRSRKMTGIERVMESLRRFDAATQRMLNDIKGHFPGISDDEAHDILDECVKRITTERPRLRG
jgi:hypothetical protein